MNCRSTNRIESVAALELVHLPDAILFHEMNEKLFLHALRAVQEHMRGALIADGPGVRNRNILRPKRVKVLRVDEVIALQPVRTFHHFVNFLEQAPGCELPDFFALLYRVAVRGQIAHVPPIEIADAILGRCSRFGGSNLSGREKSGGESYESGDSFHGRTLTSKPALCHPGR